MNLRKILLGVIVLAILLPPLSGLPVRAQGPLLEAISNLNVRTGPGTEFEAIGTIPRGTRVSLEGRNRVGNWALVNAPTGQRGWVASRYLIWGDVDLAVIPVVNTIIMAAEPSNLVGEGEGAEGALSVNTLHPTPLRQGPGTGFPTILTLPGRYTLLPQAQSPDGLWYRVLTADGAWRGWVLKDHTSEHFDGLEASDEIIQDGNVYEHYIQRLQSTPVMPSVTGRARAILASGLNAGNRRTVFSKVGDCHTDHLGFFVPLGVGEYDLGSYDELQTAIDYFSTSPRSGSTNSFVNESLAASSAFSAAAVLDPVWADPTNCASGEMPLACEYRLIQPSIALIQFGSVDMQIYTVQDFAYYLRRVVYETVNRGIVPVLTTFPSNENYLWEKSLQFNMMILEIAAEEQIPVINFWAALGNLPNRGLSDDNFHLSYDGDRTLHFTGDENQWGMELRNLVTLQALDVLKRDLLRR